jgi:aminopeptidase N
MGFLSGYLGESQVKREQIIRYQYDDKEDMFDGHSYSKGGRVLHVLRNEVGDDAFFASLKLYLTRNAYTSVEIHDLRLAFEDVTGRDLNWFFNQYFLAPGHPEISVEYSWDEGSKSVKATVKQTQDLRYMPVYNLPIVFETYAGGKKVRHTFRMSSTDSVYVLQTGSQPDYTTFDPARMLLARISEKKPKSEWVAQLQYGSGYMMRDQALKQLAGSMSDEVAVKAVIEAATDPFWATRRSVFNQLDLYSGTALRPQIRKAAAQGAVSDENALVRAAALDVLTSSSAEINDPAISGEIVAVLEKAMEDSSYSVQGRAWKSMVKYRKEETLSRVRSMGEVKDPKTSQMIAGVLMTARAPEAVTFISTQIQRWPNGYGKYGALVDLGEFLSGSDEATRTTGIRLLMDEGTSNPATLIRLGALRGLSGFTERDDVSKFIADRKLAEKNERVLKYLDGMK